MKREKEKLRKWQERLAKSQQAYDKEVHKMDTRESLYRGDNGLRPLTEKDRGKKGEPLTATHVWNIIAENIESEIDSNIPQPKVTAVRKEDEEKARLIEDMLRNEIDRLPIEELNDIQERTALIQGATGFLIDWDNTKRTHTTVGEIVVESVHPKQFIPQDGVYTCVEDMDYFFLKQAQTKEYIKARYGVDVDDESESEPEIKSYEEETASDELVTQYIAYYRNEDGTVGRYSWVNDIQLEDYDDYQARRLRRCKKCGSREMLEMTATLPTEDGIPVEMTRDVPSGACKFCGSNSWEQVTEDFEELDYDIRTNLGKTIPAETVVVQNGEPIRQKTRIPFYKPLRFPFYLQKNVSVFGQLLGDSDVDKIADQQNTINRLSKKIIDRIIKAGTRVSLPPDSSIDIDPNDEETWRFQNAADKALVDVYQFEGNLEYELKYRNEVYEESRRILGITDSMQGRRDATATSAVAKQFSAAQAAGRMESKRVMKAAAYANLFEMIFKLKLAYSDEPRPVVSKDKNGENIYKEFDRYDFLEQDAAGEWYWNDRFLFSIDAAAGLASNREAMWQETRMNLQTGAFGDPKSVETLVLFWTKMELLHYPGAGETKAHLEEMLQREKEKIQQVPGPQGLNGNLTPIQQNMQMI